MRQKVKGIIFDMDNTLLRSNIDFAGMKQETFHYFVSREILSSELNIEEHTSSTIIELAVQTGKMTKDLLEEMWEIPKKYEIIGMQGADLEPGVKELLAELHGQYRLAVVTNNSIDAALKALAAHEILDYFDDVVGREMMKALKPAPDGFIAVLNRFNELSPEEWISVGDAWVDGQASIDAGISFIAYRADLQRMKRMGVMPLAAIHDIRDVLHYI